MKLFLLKWLNANYGDVEGFVIRAESEAEARLIAEKEATGGWDNAEASCEEIDLEGVADVILVANVGE